MKKKSIIWLVIGIVLAEGLGFASSLLSGDIPGKYAAMQTPPLSPPGSVFGIAWVALYFLMAIAAFLIFRMDIPDAEKRTPLLLYVAQLLVNFIWSPIFFSGSMWIALAVIVVLVALVIATTVQFFRLNKAAGWLMVPYILWLLFATYLTVGCALLN